MEEEEKVPQQPEQPAQQDPDEEVVIPEVIADALPVGRPPFKQDTVSRRLRLSLSLPELLRNGTIMYQDNRVFWQRRKGALADHIAVVLELLTQFKEVIEAKHYLGWTDV